ALRVRLEVGPPLDVRGGLVGARVNEAKPYGSAMRFHDLRHTTATLLLRAGVDAHRGQRILRHQDVRTTVGTYSHLLIDDFRGALATLPSLPASTVPTDTANGEKTLRVLPGSYPIRKIALAGPIAARESPATPRA